MQLPKNLGPELASLTREDGTVVKAYGGLRYIAGNDRAFFSLSWSMEPPEGLVGFGTAGTAKSTGLEDFPEFDDLALLTTSDEFGVPVGALTWGWDALAIVPGAVGRAFLPVAVGEFFRISPLEASQLRQDVLDEMVSHRQIVGSDVPEDDVVAAGRAFFEAWVEDQKPRWKADAESAIAAHDLVEFGDPR